jgi:Domain of unknown function (DUF1854)
MSATNGHPIPHADLELERDEWGRLVLIDEFGRRHVGVEPVRAFPISDPTRWISLCDPSGAELVQVESLDDLAPPTRQILLAELGRREFLPIIRRIVRVANDSIPAVWEVETDRGPTRFTLDGEESVRRLGKGRALIVDGRGLRYLIVDTKALDPASRRILERYL